MPDGHIVNADAFHVKPLVNEGRSLDTFGGRLYAARLWKQSVERRSIVQATVAAAMGVTPPSVGRWEADIKEPNLATIARLAQWLGVSPGWLAFGEGEMIGAARPQPPRPLGTVPMDLGEPGIRAAEERARQARDAVADRSSPGVRAAATGGPSRPAPGSKRGR